jgi:hypothetical protein
MSCSTPVLTFKKIFGFIALDTRVQIDTRYGVCQKNVPMR